MNHHWGSTSIYRQLSYPFRSLQETSSHIPTLPPFFRVRAHEADAESESDDDEFSGNRLVYDSEEEEEGTAIFFFKSRIFENL